MKTETDILIGKFIYFLIFLFLFLALMKNHYQLLSSMNNNLFIFTVFCCGVGMGLWYSSFSLLDTIKEGNKK